MSTSFKVLPVDVQTAAANCDSTAEQLQSELSSLKSYVESLGSEWLGIAATTFQDLMTDYNVFSNMLESALRDIGSGLRGNYVNYTDSESANIQSLVAVNGEIPGANFS